MAPEKWMVGILVSFWDGLFSGAMLVSGSVYPTNPFGSCYEIIKSWKIPKTYSPFPREEPPQYTKSTGAFWLGTISPEEV